MDLTRNSLAFFVLRLDKATAQSCERILRDLSFGDVDARTYIPSKGTIRIQSRHSNIEHPPVFSVTAAEPILPVELLPPIKPHRIRVHKTLPVFRVDEFCPAVAKLDFHGKSRELQPGLIEVSKQFVATGHPDEYGGCVGHQAEAFLALPHRFLRFKAPSALP